MNKVEVGQSWRAMASAMGGVQSFVILEVSGDKATVEFPTGRRGEKSVRGLSLGRRGATLVKNADGSEPPPTNRERRTGKAPARAAMRMALEGSTRTDVANALGVHPSTVERLARDRSDS